jgi:hypothetical protein
MFRYLRNRSVSLLVFDIEVATQVLDLDPNPEGTQKKLVLAFYMYIVYLN